MYRGHLGRALVLGIGLTLAAQIAWAAPRQPQGDPGAAWSLVMRLWHAFTAGWSENGCSVDPNGTCGDGPQSGGTAESGCTVDPDGRCTEGSAGAETPAADEGCSVDPSGSCGGS